MSRRDFLKSLSLFTIVSACSFKGGQLLSANSDNSNEPYAPNPYGGAKHSGFRFSSPLPFDFNLIDELAEINKRYKKSKLVTLYGSLPSNSSELCGCETASRGMNYNVDTLDDLGKYITYAQDKGFNFVYLINSSRAFTIEEYDFIRPRIDRLLNKLKEFGCYNVKVANTQLFEALKYRKEFNVQASTSLEYTNIRQFENIFDIYPKIKNFNLAIDTNRNIPLLKNLRKKFKNVEFELMADECCLYGCPARISHTASGACRFQCEQFMDKNNKWKSVFRSNIIYPWNVDFYADLGYKSFKLMGVPCGMRPNIASVQYVNDYMQAVEQGIEGFTLNRLLATIGFLRRDKDVPLTKEILAAFPDINYFKENGGKCSINCS